MNDTKREYVSKQVQSRKHACHWPGCEQQVPPAMWGCKAHWFRLPKALRDRIWATYEPGQEKIMDGGDVMPTRAYIDAADAVEEWIRSQQP